MKIWDDCTKANGNYVAKDVKGMLAFLVGLILTLYGAFSSNTIALEAAASVLAYSLGNQVFKSHYQYKNNSIGSETGDTNNVSVKVDATACEESKEE